MQLPFDMNNPGDDAWSVGRLTEYISEMFSTDYRLQDIRVEGEISDLRIPRSGHMYFSLTDSEASIRAVMWRSQVESIPAGELPKAGDAVVVSGYVGVYKVSGQYQLYARRITKQGAGDLYQRFLELQQKLRDEGLFDRPKRELPTQPRVIGVVTSPTGAAIRDIINVLGRRWPLAEVIVFPTAVQGDAAPPQIIAALNAAYTLRPDVLIVARGGGSPEDLWCFNDERVVRHLAGAPVPTVVGVGHEIDTTLSDLVADVRAPTPSAAAEVVVPDRAELQLSVNDFRAALAGELGAVVQTNRLMLRAATAGLQRVSPLSRIVNARQRVDSLQERADWLLGYQLRRQQQRLGQLVATLRALNPDSVLARGYAIVQDEHDRVIRSTAQINHGQALRVRVADGSFGVNVTDSTEQDK